jgi:hypothetical protein
MLTHRSSAERMLVAEFAGMLSALAAVFGY